MTLGERISARRAALGWSQADLAERLDVSRQSVSKWETDASVPDLDKLVKLCDAFGVTLDQLVRGEEFSSSSGNVPPEESASSEEGAPKEAPPKEREKRPLTLRDIVGVTLIGFGCLVFLLLSMWSGDLAASAVCASVFLILGVICLVVRFYTGLWCGWVIWGMLALYLRVATGIQFHWVFASALYRKEFLTHLLLAWGQLLTLIALILFTGRVLWRLRKKRF